MMNEAQRHRLDLLAARFDEWPAAIDFSIRTRVGYAHNVKLFIDWLAQNTSVITIAEVGPAHLQQYQIAVYNYERKAGRQAEKKRLAVGTQMIRLAAVRKFFEWLVRTQQLAYNPSASIRLPRKTRNLPASVLTKAEARRLIEATPLDKPRDLRDRAILETLYSAGIRRAELIGLTIYDLNLTANTITIRQGKRAETRIVPLTNSADAVLKLYLTTARGILKKEAESARLFVSSRSGGPLDDADIVRIVAKAAKRAGIEKHITPHTLRHSFAAHLLKGKADIRHVQKLLGHRRLSSTEVYTRVEVSDLRAVLQRCHPREHKRKR